jgi:hypothetical protein
MYIDEDAFIRELRIGNLVLPYGKSNFEDVREVCLISLDIDDEYMPLIETVEVGKHNNCNGDILRNFHPIPLTESWITKLGLFVETEFMAWGVKTNCIYTSIGGGIYLIKKSDHKWIIGISSHDAATIDSSDGDELNHISYVHQLQNLYFYITGDELKIKN